MAAPQPLPTNFASASFRSMAEMWNYRVGSTPESTAMMFRQQGRWASMSWREADARVRAIAGALLRMGLEPEQRCAILSGTRVEWVLADMATVCAAGATTSIYPSHTDDECAYILGDCEAQVLFAESAHHASRVHALRDSLPNLRKIVVFDEVPASEDGLIVPLSSFEAEGQAWLSAHPDALAIAQAGICAHHLATLIYTSGTTGTPKGVMLTHDSWVYEAEAIDQLGLINPADVQFLVLPLSHVFAKVMQVIFIRQGVPTAIDGNTDRLMDHLGQIAPTWMGAVPRIFEKAYNRIVAEARDAGQLRWRTFRWAVGVGRKVSRLQQQRREPGRLLKAQHALADRLVFAKVRERFGGRLRFLISGGAPLAPELAEFFHAAGILICEGYGLTESAAASTVNTPSDFIFGTVGRPLPGTEVRIADDGEVLIRGRGVMRGYVGEPQGATACIQDGWLHTGDIGTLLPSGHLAITDRKKELIVTASGKNVAPANFQSQLKAASPFVAHVLMHGDRRNFCSALVAIHEDAVARWAKAEGITWKSYADLASKPEVIDLVRQAVDDVNRTLPSYEQVKRFALVPEDFTVANGLLTPSMKMKRRAIEARYADILDRFYDGTLQRL